MSDFHRISLIYLVIARLDRAIQKTLIKLASVIASAAKQSRLLAYAYKLKPINFLRLPRRKRAPRNDHNKMLRIGKEHPGKM
jgi:hypothetical protein